MLKSILRYFDHNLGSNEFFDLIGDAVSSGSFLPATEHRVILEGVEGGRIVFRGDFDVTNGEVLGGTISGFKAFVDGEKVMKGSFYKLPFEDFQAALDEGSEAAILALITAGETIGSNGADTIFGISKVLRGFDGDDIIFSSFGNKTIEGGDGDDVIFAGLGNDNIYGGKGRDSFGFVTDGDGVDKLRDFSVKKDKIGFNDSEFTVLGETIEATEFIVGEAAETVDQHIIYDKDSEKLYWDEDGLGGVGQILLARLPDGAKLTVANLYVDDLL